MTEIYNHYQYIQTGKAHHIEMAMATVVSKKGSSYRRPGARMIVTQEGDKYGIIGGGCFDEDVKELSVQVINDGITRLKCYDMSDTNLWGLGLGCNGSVYILIESLSTPQGEKWIQEVGHYLKKRQTLMIKHKFPVSLDFRNTDFEMKVNVQRDYDHSPNASEEDNTKDDASHDNTFCELLEPSPHLIIFGAGQDAIPVVEMANKAGFYVSVVDHRSDLLSHSRFAHASNLIHSFPDDYAKNISPSAGDHVLLMTHDIEKDTAAFDFYAQHAVNYVGFLGPKNRTDNILNNKSKTDLSIRDHIQEMIYAPVGLDLGSETADEVALSIVAELLAVKNQRNARFLRDKKTSIHAQ